MSRASPSKRSMTRPRASGKFLSGSASTTSPTVHFQPLAAALYTLDLLTSSFSWSAHSFVKALIAMHTSSSRPLGSPRRGRGAAAATKLHQPETVARGHAARARHAAVHAHVGVLSFGEQTQQLRRRNG